MSFAMPSGISKIIGKSFLAKLEIFILTNCTHFGFKEHNSPELCVFAVNESTDYYRKLGIPTFICFINIRSAFDRMGHSRLFEQLSGRGTTDYVIQLL